MVAKHQQGRGLLMESPSPLGDGGQELDPGEPTADVDCHSTQ